MQPHRPEETRESRAADRFWNVLSAFLYLGSMIFVGFGSYIVLPIFGFSGLALIGMTVLFALIGGFLFWVFTKIWSVFDGL